MITTDSSGNINSLAKKVSYSVCLFSLSTCSIFVNVNKSLAELIKFELQKIHLLLSFKKNRETSLNPNIDSLYYYTFLTSYLNVFASMISREKSIISNIVFVFCLIYTNPK
jgi:hypothetical protein